MAQVLANPASTDGRAHSPSPWDICPTLLSPQQSTMPSSRTPHEWEAPALTWMKRPGGFVAWPRELKPQHSTAPSLRTAQAFSTPALT